MSLFSDILDKNPEEEIRDLKEEVADLMNEVHELTTEIEAASKRANRNHDLLRQTRTFIQILRDKMSDAEYAEAESDFNERLREEKAQAKLEEDQDEC